MNAPVFIGEHLSLGALAAPFTYTILFESNKPVSNEQFFAFAEAVNRLITKDVVQIAPIDQTHFYATVNAEGGPVEPGDIVGEAQNIAGITFTATGLYEGAYRPEEKKRLSTGAVVGIWTVILGAGGTVFYLTTRKVKPRRRKAA